MAVLSDNVSGVSTLVRHVHGLGHRKIAFLHGERTSVTGSRLEGFHQACRELGLEIPEEYIIECVYHDPDRCAEATRQLLSLPDRPTCILFPDDFSYLGGMNALLEAGLRIPEDISAVGYDGIHLAQVLGLTTYSQNARTLGKTAAQKLINLIERPAATTPEQLLIQGSLVEGRSVRDIR